jgi:hypothetical protein
MPPEAERTIGACSAYPVGVGIDGCGPQTRYFMVVFPTLEHAGATSSFLGRTRRCRRRLLRALIPAVRLTLETSRKQTLFVEQASASRFLRRMCSNPSAPSGRETLGFEVEGERGWRSAFQLRFYCLNYLDWALNSTKSR